MYPTTTPPPPTIPVDFTPSLSTHFLHSITFPGGLCERWRPENILGADEEEKERHFQEMKENMENKALIVCSIKVRRGGGSKGLTIELKWGGEIQTCVRKKRVHWHIYI